MLELYNSMLNCVHIYIPKCPFKLIYSEVQPLIWKPFCQPEIRNLQFNYKMVINKQLANMLRFNNHIINLRFKIF